ncbi:MFS transporter [Pelagibius sp. Alg239-R121]|uniref:MFS transporter n=1 Tax=Pelagibius sp. Alg239-R121 TaxID=2993448 RepID=UPI002AC33730|nr:MFS transporter [Pelagibius sp. Alg239-R121]
MPAFKHSHLVPWILSLGMFVIGTTSLSILGVGPAMTRDLAVSPGAAGWLVTAFAATFAVVAPIAQFALGKRYSPRSLIIVGTVILTAALTWAALAAGFSSLLFSRIAAALGSSLIAPTSAAVAVAMTPVGRRGAVLAIVFTGFTLSTVAGVPIMTWLTLMLDWRGAMAAIAVAALLLLLLVLAVLPNETIAVGDGGQDETPSVGLWKPTMVLLATLGMLAAQFTIYSLMGELLGQEFSVSDAGLPAAILLFGIFGVAGNAAAGFLTDRVGSDVLVWVSITGLAALLLLMNADLGPVYGTLVLAGCAFAGTLFTTPQQSRLVEIVHQDRHALILAVNSSASYLGIAFGSGLASLLAMNTGLSVLPVAALIVLSLVGAINLLVQFRSQSR